MDKYKNEYKETGKIDYSESATDNSMVQARRFRQLFESMGQGVVYFDSDGRIMEANPAALEILGLSRDQLMGLTSFDPRWRSIHEDGTDYPGESHPAIVALRSGKAVRGAIMGVYHPLEESYRWVIIDAIPGFRAGEERPFEVYASFTDFTELRTRSEALRESELHFRRLADSSLAMIWESGPDMLTTYFNNSWLDFTGRSLSQELGEGWLEGVHPEDRSSCWSIYSAAFEKRENFTTEYRMRNADGEYRWIQDNGSPRYDIHGNFVGYIGFCADVHQLKEIEHNYQLLFSQMPVGFALHEMVLDDEGRAINYRFLAVNPAFERMTGLSAKQVLGRCVLEALPGTEKYWIDTYARVALAGATLSFENYTKSLDKHFQVTAFSPRKGRFACMFLDVTERQQLMEAASRAAKLDSLGVLAGGIAHDFNNLLGGIFGFLDLAKSAAASTPKVLGYLEKALSVFNRAKSLTQQLLTFSKGGAPVRKRGNIGPFIRASAEFVLSGSNVGLEFDLAEDLSACEYDEGQIGQVVDNILINAKQAMPAGGKVKISAQNARLPASSLTPAGSYLKLSMRDTGPGIPEEIRSRVFDPFFSTKKEGSGLGLATCYSIVKKHGGLIELESEMGRGSCFHIFLPASNSDETEVKEEIASGQRSKGLVLILDDEDFMREILAEILSCLGYESIGAADGAEALKLCRSLGSPGPVAAIFDLTVPHGLGGKEALDLIRANMPNFPVFASSGFSDDPILAEPLEYGFAGSLRKPFTIEDVGRLFEKLHIKPN